MCGESLLPAAAVILSCLFLKPLYISTYPHAHIHMTHTLTHTHTRTITYAHAHTHTHSAVGVTDATGKLVGSISVADLLALPLDNLSLLLKPLSEVRVRMCRVGQNRI